MLIKLHTWSYLEIRIQDELTIKKMIVPLKGWKSSMFGNDLNASKFRKKLRGN